MSIGHHRHNYLNQVELGIIIMKKKLNNVCSNMNAYNLDAQELKYKLPSMFSLTMMSSVVYIKKIGFIKFKKCMSRYLMFVSRHFQYCFLCFLSPNRLDS